jgi:hypothetical protein
MPSYSSSDREDKQQIEIAEDIEQGIIKLPNKNLIMAPG